MSNSGKRVLGTKDQNAGRWPALLFLALFAPTAFGQAASGASPAASANPQSPTVTSNVDEVSLNLIVHDKNRKLIRDLKPEDLAISDNDMPVTLKGLHLVSADSGTEHLVTMVFDSLEGATGKNAQNIAEKILKVIPSSGYSFTVLDIPGRLRLIQGFSDDRNAVRQAVKLVTEIPADKTPVVTLTATNTIVKKAADKPDDARTVAASLAEKNLVAITRTGADTSGTHVDVKVRARYQALLSALEGARQIRQDQHALPNLAGLLALVRSQQKLSARKSLIYFTENEQLDSASKDMVHTIAGAANQSGVTLYIVDMNALNVGGRHQIDSAMGAQNIAFNPAAQAVAGSGGMAMSTPMQQRGAMSEGGSNVGIAVDWLRQSDKNPFSDVKSPLSDMAKNTGGAYIDAQDSVKRPLQQMVEDMTTYYQASYVPPITEYDGSFRTIVAKPLRSGMNIKTKTGYFAVASSSEGTVRPFEAPLLKLMSQPQLPTDLKFNAAIVHFGELPDGNTSTVAVEVPISALEVKKDTHTNLFSAHVSVVAEIKDKAGTVVEHFGEDIARRGALESIDKDPSASISLQRHFLAVPGQYTLEVAVLDRTSEKAGAQRISFEIPAQSSPSLSELVLVKKVDAFHEEDDPQEPMRYEKGRITPNLSGDVLQNAKSVSLFFILHPDAKSKSPATLEMIASRNGRPGKRMPLPLNLGEAGSSVPYMANFKSGLPPGDYEVKAMLSQDGKTSVQSLSFTVEGDQPASAAGGALANTDKHGDAAAAAFRMSAGEGTDAPLSGLLAITPLTNPVPPPSEEETRQLIADARERALHYIDSLPNFMCVEVTTRSVDATGSGRWKLRDTISELLRYHDKAETRTMLQVNGKANTVNREAMKGTFSAGELGGVLKAVFLDSAKADFQWKEIDALGSGTLQAFTYSVAQKNSVFSVVGKNDKQVMVGFRGQVFIDSTTRNVRRITLEAVDLPRDFPTHSTSIAVDYDYVAINAHDYLMPISAELRLKQGRREAILNTIEFRDYRRFGSNMRIVGGFTPVEK